MEKEKELEKYLEEILKTSKYYGFEHIGCDCYKYKNVYVELREETITDINGNYEMDYAVFETEEDMNTDYELNIMTDYMSIENAKEFWQYLQKVIDRNCIDTTTENKNLIEQNLLFAIIEDMLIDCENDLYEYEDIDKEKADLIYKNVELYTLKLKEKLQDSEYIEIMKKNRLS